MVEEEDFSFGIDDDEAFLEGFEDVFEEAFFLDESGDDLLDFAGFDAIEASDEFFEEAGFHAGSVGGRCVESECFPGGSLVGVFLGFISSLIAARGRCGDVFVDREAIGGGLGDG